MRVMILLSTTSRFALTFTLGWVPSWLRGPTCRWVIKFRRVALAWSTITARRTFLHPSRLIRRCVAERLQVATESAFARRKWVFPPAVRDLSLLTWSHVIWSADCRHLYLQPKVCTAECCGVHWGGFEVSWCRELHKSSPSLGKRKSEPLLPPSPPRNETRSTLEWSTHPTQSEHHRSHWIATSKRSLEGVCTSCTNQAHYNLVRMCTPCSEPHPPPNWRSRSGVVVTSYHVLIGSGSGAVYTRGPHIRKSVFHVHLCATSPSCTVTDPSVTESKWHLLCCFLLHDTIFSHDMHNSTHCSTLLAPLENTKMSFISHQLQRRFHINMQNCGVLPQQNFL